MWHLWQVVWKGMLFIEIILYSSSKMGSLYCDGGSTWYNMNENLPKRQTTFGHIELLSAAINPK